MNIWKRLNARSEEGQALLLFAVSAVILLGFVGFSVDVGRYMWAKGELQSAVDSAALAGAQSMPNGNDEAETQATAYWDKNKAAIIDQGSDVTVDVTFPGGNRAVKVEAAADVSTWFVRFFGVEEWHVEASAKAESQVVDLALVLDTSGSMCFTSYEPVEGDGPNWKGLVMGPGRSDPYSTYVFPKLTQAIPDGNGTSITIYLNSVSVFNTTNATAKGNLFGGYFDNDSTNKYHQIAPNGGRAGIIRIDDELFKITAVNATNNTLTVTRGQYNYVGAGSPTTKVAHPAFSEVWANRSSFGSSDYCDMASYNAASASVDGPHQPFDSALDNSQYFLTLFNPAFDKIGVARYSSTASILANLTGTSYATVDSAIDGLTYPTGGTNIAHGISRGRAIINGTGNRPNSIKVIVLLTDGNPTDYCSGQTSTSASYGNSSCSNSSAGLINTCTTTTAVTHAINQAAVAASQGIIVYTIGLGDDVVDCVLEDIAEAGGGEYFKAPTTAQLDEAFEAIAEKTHIGLTD
jgi:Flp pilus assembly protein TadG